MNLLAYIALIGIVPLVFALFLALPARRAVLASYVIAWLFLPSAGIAIPGMPNWDKVTATAVPVLLAVALFDSRRLLAFRFQWFDAPMVAWCLVPIISSLTNDLGLYDGLSSAFQHIVTWGLPYLMGRLYITDANALHDLAVAVVLGGIVYVPLCLWEIRMSPQLHNTFYGFHQHAFIQHVRAGTHRPLVFMQHGLAVAIWMGISTLLAFALWRTGTRVKLLGVSMGWIALVLGVTTVLCRSVGPTMLMVAGLVGYAAVFHVQARRVLLGLAIIVPLYLMVRVPAVWDGEELLDLFEPFVAQARVESLELRLEMENTTLVRAHERPMFGWGGWGRHLGEADAEEMRVLDSMWISAYGRNGIVGLIAYVSMLLLPIVLVARLVPTRLLRTRGVGMLAGLAVMIAMYAMDKMVNAMTNPMVMFAAGGSMVCAWKVAVQRRRARAAPPTPSRDRGEVVA